jgi:bacillithiol biosynthesis cysteine-adding enzyme BshC
LTFLQHINLDTAGIGGALTHDYLSAKPVLQNLYQFSPDVEGLKKATAQRIQYPVNRQLLYEVLHEQYGKLHISNAVKNNIELLLQENSFTITTGHQLNLFTGPLYFIYKIASAISLSRTMNDEMPGRNFIPVYWMNSEDHDFMEINHFFLHGEKFEWKEHQDKYGPVGRMSIDSMAPLIQEIGRKFETLAKHETNFAWMLRSYSESGNLAEAHQFIVNKLFGEYGLVILDQDASRLKAAYSNRIADEILNQSSVTHVETTNKYLMEHGYKPQVFLRDINFFYTGTGARERIVVHHDGYATADHSVLWTREALVQEIKDQPGFFSPNVVTRPMYQECVLPNIAYIGGPAEIAYWLQYKSNFDAKDIFYPALILRDCFLVLPEKKVRKAKELDLTLADFFEPLDGLINRYIKQHFGQEMNIEPIASHIQAEYARLLEQVRAIDASMDGMVQAQEQKTFNGLERIVAKMNKRLKIKNEVQLKIIRDLHTVIFPAGVLQERHDNLFDVTTSSAAFIEEVITHANPLDARLKIWVD